MAQVVQAKLAALGVSEWELLEKEFVIWKCIMGQNIFAGVFP